MIQNITEIIRKLETYTNVTFPIISVYLPLTREVLPHNPNLSQRFTVLVEKAMPAEEQELYQGDLDYIASFLQEYRHTAVHKGIALFSGGNKLWEIVTTPFTLPEQLAISHTPYLTPLKRELQSYERYLIILADREKTRLFTLFLGELEDQFEISDKSVPQKVKGRGGSERIKKVDRYIRDHLNRHLHLVGREVAAFTREKRISGVIVGGHKTLLHDIEAHLPQPIQQKIIGEFTADTDEDINAVVAESKSVIRKYQESSPLHM